MEVAAAGNTSITPPVLITVIPYIQLHDAAIIIHNNHRSTVHQLRFRTAFSW